MMLYGTGRKHSTGRKQREIVIDKLRRIVVPRRSIVPYAQYYLEKAFRLLSFKGGNTVKGMGCACFLFFNSSILQLKNLSD